MSLDVTVALVNFGIIVLLFVCGKLIDAAADRDDSAKT